MSGGAFICNIFRIYLFFLSDLVLWDYYVKEELRYGPAYDLEIAGLELQQEQEVDSLTDQPSLRLAKHTMTRGREYI